MTEESDFYNRRWADREDDLPPVAEPDAVLLRRLRETGVEAAHAVPAFSGLYPQFGGLGSMSLLFTRQRILALTGTGQLQLWAAYTGPSPTRLIEESAAAGLRRKPGNRGQQYDEWHVGNTRLWIDRKFRRTVDSWRKVQG